MFLKFKVNMEILHSQLYEKDFAISWAYFYEKCTKIIADLFLSLLILIKINWCFTKCQRLFD